MSICLYKFFHIHFISPKIRTEPIFGNNSSNRKSQILIKRHLLITLIRMGNYGNAVFLAKIGDLYGMRKGTMDKICQQVIMVIQSSNIQITHVR